MKTFRLLFVTLTALVLTSSAQNCLTSNDQQTPNPEGKQRLYTGQQEFSLNMLQSVNAHNPTSNIFFSPYSTYHALLMAYFISSNTTEMYLKKLLKLDPKQTKFDIYSAYKLDKFVTKFQNDGKGDAYEFANANRVYVEKNIKVRDCMTTLLQDELDTQDFQNAPDQSRLNINAWVEEKTQHMIKDILPAGSLDSSTNLVIANAAFFKGLWENKFDAANTKLDVFHISPSNRTFVDMMNVQGSFNFDISEDLRAHILELPYKGGDISMYIILPPFATEDGVSHILKQLTLEQFKKIAGDESKLWPRTVNVSLPKFNLEHTIELVPYSNAMALRILNQNHLSLVKKTVGRTAPLCRRLRCRCMSISKSAGASVACKSDDPSQLEGVDEMEHRLMLRPLTHRHAKLLQPQNLPEYGKQEPQWTTSEHLRYRSGDLDYIAVMPKSGLHVRSCIPSTCSTTPYQGENTHGTRAYCTYLMSQRLLNHHHHGGVGVHLERPLALNYVCVLPKSAAVLQQQGRSYTDDAYKMMTPYTPSTGNALSRSGLGNCNSCILGEAPAKGSVSNCNQMRLAHKSSRKKTVKKILEEWNRRSSQDYLRIDNILYKYKRKEMQRKGLLIEDCPKNKKKQSGGKKKQPHGKHPSKGKKKHKKKPGCKNKKLRVQCASLEKETEDQIEAALDELVGTPPATSPKRQSKIDPKISPICPAEVKLPPTMKQYANIGKLTRKDTMNYMCDRNMKENQALENLVNNTPKYFKPAVTPAPAASAVARPFSTTTAMEAPPQLDSSLQQINKAYAYEDELPEEDIDFMVDEPSMERADDMIALHDIVKPLPAFRPMKLPAEAMMPPRGLVDASPLPRLRKRSDYDELEAEM